MMAGVGDDETQPFDESQSSLSPLEQFPMTDRFDDAAVVDSPLDDEILLENLGFDTELVDDRDCFDYEKDVVLDSEDENDGNRTNAKRRFGPDSDNVGDLAVDSGLFDRVHLEGNKPSSINVEIIDGGKDMPLLSANDHEFKRLNYISSQEPGESTQEKALGFVDQYLSFNKMDLSKGIDSRNTVTRVKSPLVSCAKGLQSLAKRIKLITPIEKTRTFEWVDSYQQEGGDYFSKRVECEEKEKFVSESEMVENKFVMDLDEQFNAESAGQQLDATAVEGDTSDMFDVGFNTQIAAEAITALSYLPSAVYNSTESYLGPQTAHDDSARHLTENVTPREHSSLTKSPSSDLKAIAKKSRRRSYPATVSRGRSVTSKMHSKQESEPKLAVSTKAKRRRSLDIEQMNLRSPVQAKISCRRSPNLGKQRTKGTAVDIKGPISVEHIVLGERLSEGNSTVAHRIRQQWSRGRLACTENLSVTDKVEESCISKIRRKRSALVANTLEVNVRGKYPKLNSNASWIPRNSELGQQESRIVDRILPSGLNTWNHPKRKRTIRGTQRHSNGASNLYTSLTRADGIESNVHSTVSQLQSNGGAGTTYSDLAREHKTRSSVHTCLSAQSAEKNPGGSLLRQNINGLGSEHAIFNCNLNVTYKSMFPAVPDRAKASAQSIKSDSVKNLTSADIPTKNHTSRISSEYKFEHNKGDHNKGIHVASTSPLVHKYHKRRCNKNPPKLSLLKELIGLGIFESIPDFTQKDFRSRRDMAYIRVLFSQHLDDSIIKRQKKILVRLGISIALCCIDATHFIADNFTRTRNMLEAIALGKPVVTHLWLESCGQAGYLIDEKNYILRDARKEREIGFSMPVSLARASQHPLLKGQSVFITPNTKPDIEIIKILVKAVHGQVLERRQISGRNHENVPNDVLIISCEEDRSFCQPFLERGTAVYTSELLLNGIVIQKLEYQRHQLFRDGIKRNCTKKSPRTYSSRKKL